MLNGNRINKYKINLLITKISSNLKYIEIIVF